VRRVHLVVVVLVVVQVRVREVQVVLVPFPQRAVALVAFAPVLAPMLALALALARVLLRQLSALLLRLGLGEAARQLALAWHRGQRAPAWQG
jgi:hypothetical protein